MNQLVSVSAAALLTFAGVAAAQPCDAFFDFESMALGTAWGNPTHAPGDLAFSGSDIDVYVWPHSNGAFGFSQIQLDPTGGSCAVDNHTLRFNNINMQWDFSPMPGTVSGIRFAYVDLGGSIDLRVNGAPMWTGTDLTAAPAAIAPGVTLSVTQIATAGGVCGVAELSGKINGVMVGGQEFWVDNVCVTTCYADINNDGVLNILDFVDFQNLFSAGSPDADCNGDGVLNILDFVCFQNVFAAGC